MPGYERAPVSAELKVVTSDGGGTSPEDQISATKEAAGASGLAAKPAGDRDTRRWSR